MGRWEEVYAEPDFTAVSGRERRGGFYRRYHPDLMARAVHVLDRDTAEHVHDVGSQVAVLGERLRAHPLPLLYATLIRSESIASSWVEGERAPARTIMLARLDHDLTSSSGRTIVRNIDAMSAAIAGLDATWRHEDIHHIHHTLLPELPVGYRRVPVYLGGRSPLRAQFVPPPHESVPAYLDDLLAYVNGSGDPPLTLALLTHAQFETVHPFPDGNGRVGRAMFHAALHRAGVVTGGVLPLSRALQADPHAYDRALTAYQYDGNNPDDRRTATSTYVEAMLDFVVAAIDLTATFATQVDEVLDQWRHALARFRRDSSVHRAVDVLIQQPVVTAAYLQEQLGVTKMAAYTTLNHLVDAQILRPSGGRLKRANLFQADAVLDVLEPRL